MTTIEKEKVLDVVRQMVADGQVSQEVAEKYFPELAESEDEKIRKELLDFCKNRAEKYHNDPKYKNISAWIAWLEKQDVQKSDTDFSDLRTWKYIVDAVWTEKEGIGQYLDSPFTEEVAKKLQKRFGNIEQKPVIEEVNGEDYGIDGLWHAQKILEKTLGCVDGYQSDDGILDHKAAITAVKKLYEWKSIDKAKQKFKVKYADGEYNVLEVKDIFGVTFYGIEDEPNHIDYVRAEHCEIIGDYSIKENDFSVPTKPIMFSEWSEEDEKYIRLSMDIIESALRAGFCVQLDRDRCVDWLNSLRSQKQWRPSEDQMKALAEALSLAKNCGEESAFALRTLHEQLKKLREE